MAGKPWEDKILKSMAQQLIKKIADHSHLLDLIDQDKIKFFFVEKGSFDGRAKKLNGSTAEAASTIFIVEMNYEAWHDLPESQRWALLDTQLSRCMAETSDAGDTKYFIQKPDFEGFLSVGSRWGSWNDLLEKYESGIKGTSFASFHKSILEGYIEPNPTTGYETDSEDERNEDEESSDAPF